jgi:protease IV
MNNDPSNTPTPTPGPSPAPSQDETLSDILNKNQAPAQSNSAVDATDSVAGGNPSLQPGWERATLEKLAFASLNEQKTARKWKNFVRLAWLVFFIAIAWYMFMPMGNVSGKDMSSQHTAVVEIKGEIGAGSEASSDLLIPALRAAFEDDGALAVVLLINSPGGSPVHAGMLNDEIIRLKEKHKKPVYAVVEDSCASAAYYIAVAADEIFVDKASIVGSIGVLMDSFGFTGLMEKLGVERRLMTAGENKGFLDPFSPQTDKQRAFAQQMLNQIHTQFIDTVKKGRGKKLKETPEMFSGLFWSGQQAIELGLADSLGTLDFVAREVVKAEDIVDYTRRDNVAERLAKRFGAALGEGAVKALRTLPALK